MAIARQTTRDDAFTRHQVTRVESALAPEHIEYEVNKLRFDYRQIDAADREFVQLTALDINTRYRRAAEDAIAIGFSLRQVQDRLRGDCFVDWLRVEFGMTISAAYDFMNMSKRFGDDRFPISGKLNISSLRLLSSPSVPDTVIWQALAQTEAQGHSLTVDQAKAMISAAREPRPALTTREIQAEYSVTKVLEVLEEPVPLLEQDPIIQKLVTLNLEDTAYQVILQEATLQQLDTAFQSVIYSDRQRRQVLRFNLTQRQRSEPLDQRLPLPLPSQVGLLLSRELATALQRAALSGALKTYLESAQLDKLLVSLDVALKTPSPAR